MVATVRDVGTKALQKLGVLRAGGTAKDGDIETCRESLQSFYAECITAGTFGRVANVVIGAEATVTGGVNQHINITTPDAVVVDLPAVVEACYWYNYEPYGDYGWPWCNPNSSSGSGVMVPPDKSVIMVTDQYGPSRATYVYDGTIQRWMRTDSLALADEAPLSARSTDGLSAVLALRIADEFGTTLLSPLTLRASNSYRLALVQEYSADAGCW